MAQLVEIGEKESWELLAERPICRVGWNGSDGPDVLPLNYVVFDGALWLRTSAHSALSQEIDDTQVAILVDRLDDDAEVGWSVQVRGVAEVHYSVDTVPPEVQNLQTWAGGARPLWIKVKPTAINGRRLSAD
ncbi:MAG: pyridoxamine 5'-phosphate oxidase family protein [Nocardioides sp.]|uniref:pyridoxamine 5'-phosphate oxidase family protein n=1 Tax=Nocardioides sp. TaxID=35761 RepID=UPI0039E5C3D8